MAGLDPAIHDFSLLLQDVDTRDKPGHDDKKERGMIIPDGDYDVHAGKTATVVTHLEMIELPAIPPDPAGAWTLRRVEAPDLDWYRELYRRVGDDWLWIDRVKMSDAELASIIQAPLVEVYALVHEGRDEGLLDLDFREAGQCEIVYFGVTAKLVGSGAGRWLMNRAQEIAWSRPIARLWLHTCTHDHPGAVAFYLRSGFRAFLRQIEIEDDPRIDGSAPRDAARHVPVIE
jgi:GNAT superfamily N-acetyltransferase